jgi:GT2 family glycosyltransferase
MLKISFVIPFFNSEKTLPLCLQAMEAQTIQPFEVILVDNNSTDNSRIIAKNFVASHPSYTRYLSADQQGPSQARNLGAEAARGKIIAFIDSDCIADSRLCADLVTAFEKSKIGAVAGKIIGFGKKSLWDKFHFMFTLKSLSNEQNFSEFTLVRGGFPAANLAIRKDVFEHIGGFDESLQIYSEDYDLCARIYKAGFIIKYVTDAIVYHKHRNNLKATWKQSFGFGKGHAILLKKYGDRRIIIELPKYQFICQKWPIRLWLDLSGADKKLLGLIFLSIAWMPFTVLIPVYFGFLLNYMGNRLRQNHMNANFWEKLYLIFFLILKSAAITSGRLIGSLRNRVLCF